MALTFGIRAIALAALVVTQAAFAAAPVRVTTPIGGGSIDPGGTRDIEVSDDAAWAFFTSSNDQMVAGDTGHADVFAYSMADASLRRLTLNPANSAGPAHDCDLLDVSSNGRHVLIHCQRSGWFEPYTDPVFDVIPLIDEYALIDRDTDADGIFDEPGATRLALVNDLDAGVRAPLFGTPEMSMSPNGRFVVMFGLFYLWPCDTHIWVRDRDTDADGVYDEVGANSLYCVPGTYTTLADETVALAATGEAFFSGLVFGHPSHPTNPEHVAWTVDIASGAITRLSPTSAGSMTFAVGDVSNDGRRVVLHAGGFVPTSPILPGSNYHDRDNGTWIRPFEQDERFRLIGGGVVSMDPTGSELLLLIRASAVSAATQVYTWHRGQAFVRRIAGLPHGSPLSEDVQDARAIAGRYLVRVLEPAFSPSSNLFGYDAYLFDGEFDAGIDVDPFYFVLDANGVVETGPVVGHPFSIFVRTTLTGQGEGPPLRLEISPLDAYRDIQIVIGDDKCTNLNNVVITCPAVHATNATAPLIRVSLTPKSAGSHNITVAFTSALPDANASNDSVTLTMNVTSGGGGGGGGAADWLLILAGIAGVWRRRDALAR